MLCCREYNYSSVAYDTSLLFDRHYDVFAEDSPVTDGTRPPGCDGGDAYGGTGEGSH